MGRNIALCMCMKKIAVLTWTPSSYLLLKLVCESVRTFIASVPYSYNACESFCWLLFVLFVKICFQTSPVQDLSNVWALLCAALRGGWVLGRAQRCWCSAVVVVWGWLLWKEPHPFAAAELQAACWWGPWAPASFCTLLPACSMERGPLWLIFFICYLR